MPKTSSLQSGLTRRGFLKTTGAVAGAAALAGSIAVEAIAEVAGEEGAEGEERIVNSFHHPNCYGFCQVNCHVRDGRLVKVTRAEMPDPYYNRICHRGLSAVQNTYDGNNRNKYPMRRAEGTERGAEQWERISWDEAVEEITAKIKGIQSEYGPQALANRFGASGGGFAMVMSTLMNLLNATGVSYSTDQNWVPGWNRVCGSDPGAYWAFPEIKDMLNSKTIVSWSNNVTEAQPQDWHAIAEAMENGTKLVVVDPTYTVLAQKADLWIPIRPASDPALYLSLIQVMLSEDLQDDDFLRDHTCAPFLVREDTGKFLRLEDLGEASANYSEDAGIGVEGGGNVNGVNDYAFETQSSPVVVWDESVEAFVAIDEAVSPAMAGSFEVNGIRCTTALDLLRKEADLYPPEVASEITDVPAETIVELARICADGPVSHRLGYGSEQYSNGVHIGHGLAALVAMTGNIGKPGASAGTSVNMYYGVNFMVSYRTETSFPSASMTDWCFKDVMDTGKYMGRDWPVKAMWISGCNPVSTSVFSKNYVENVFPQLDLIVVQDVYYTDTCKYADYILPVCDWFETQALYYCVGSAPCEVVYGDKAIEPLFESKSDPDIARLFADAFGFEGVMPATDDDFIREFIETPTSISKGITLDSLKEKGRVRYCDDDVYIPYKDWTFTTPSGRMEFYAESPVPRVDEGQEIDVEREHLPRFFLPTEAWTVDVRGFDHNPLSEKYPFVLLSLRHRSMAHSVLFGNVWERELMPEPQVHINPADAQAKGIDNHSYAEIFNDRGAIVYRVVYDDGVRRGTLQAHKNFQSRQHKDGRCMNTLLQNAWDPVGVNENFYDNLADIRPWSGKEA